MIVRTTIGTTSMTPIAIMFSIEVACGPIVRLFGLEPDERYSPYGAIDAIHEQTRRSRASNLTSGLLVDAINRRSPGLGCFLRTVRG